MEFLGTNLTDCTQTRDKRMTINTDSQYDTPDHILLGLWSHGEYDNIVLNRETALELAVTVCAHFNAQLQINVDLSPSKSWPDKADQWSDRITAANPMFTGEVDNYLTAMEMVGNRHSKGALVALVNWLLRNQKR